MHIAALVLVPQVARRSDEGPTDGVLVRAARQGEAWATAALFRRYVHTAYALAFRLLGREADAEDLVQDSFAAAFVGLGNLEDPNAFRGWLRGIVVRTAHKRIRSRSLLRRLGLVRSEPIDIDAFASNTASPDIALSLGEVHEVIEKLPSDQRLALVLRHVEELKLEEVAELTGMSLATVKRKLAQAESTLKEHREAA